MQVVLDIKNTLNKQWLLSSKICPLSSDNQHVKVWRKYVYLNNNIDCIDVDLKKGTKGTKRCGNNVCKIWKNEKQQSQHTKQEAEISIIICRHYDYRRI